ncbi:MAG TPA: putative baseplate assembly protein [Pyrinomonadaceae bacterium]|nr:putative baseplate assembly protein [Pyrinomonadaceae bacterium]
MKQICGCCEGIEQVTPVSSGNRPGLSSLAYRVGTHATFLESMLARVSLHSFETTPNDPYPVTNPSPLRSLLTRESDDPAVAFLDAWATVADVLTFYQERIANEGFLRTAIERRSILELAWLIGYQLRPGVASSTYLAYTMEKESEVLIPAGTLAQSVPGPGELPQPFETAENLHARDDWNLLQVRLTRPQVLTEQLVSTGKPIYFKGTATNLKVGDPLLMVFPNPGPKLFRVIRVETDADAGHTKVIVQDWNPPPERLAAISPPPAAVTLRSVIARHRDAQTNFGINVNARMAMRVLDQLDKLNTQAANQRDLPINKDLRDPDREALKTTLTDALPALREEHRQARDANFTKLEPWIASLIAALEDILQNLKSMDGLTPAQSSLVQVGSLLKILELPPSKHPRSAQQLGQSIRGVLSTESDALPKILTTLRPSLAGMFYRAWKNLNVTPPPATQAFALRTRASVYGHNAPLKTILDDDGRITGFEEWTISEENGESATEEFSLNLIFSITTPSLTVEATMTAGGVAITSVPQTINLAAPPSTALNILTVTGPIVETVELTVSDVVTDNQSARFTFRFTHRRFDVMIDWKKGGHLIIVDSKGDNLVTVTHDVGPLFQTVNSAATSDRGGVITVLGKIKAPAAAGKSTELPDVVSLELPNTRILPQSWVALEKPRDPSATSASAPLISKVLSVRDASRADYGISGKGSRLELSQPWIKPTDGFEVIRGTTVFAESELLELAEEPIDPVTEAVLDTRIELANLVNGLEPGRWLIITGERADVAPKVVPGRRRIKPIEPIDDVRETVPLATAILPSENDGSQEPLVPGVKASELVMLAGVEQSFDPALPGDRTHTTLLLSEPLAYRYKRDTVKIYGNVARATNGETRNEVLGSGNASQGLQSFELRQLPLTYLSMPTPRGAESTLEVRVNDVLWHEVESLADLGPRDRNYVTRTDDESRTTIIFGNGEHGARLPTGSENIKTVYRTGIGLPGNVKAGQITLPITKPLGVKEVVNPLPATGGADRENRDEGRRNAPLAVMSLDRIVSTRDYEDFARTFAGVAKASATRLSDGLRQVVHLTIAGEDDAPISVNSDLYRNLRAALTRYGDPFQPIQIATRFLKLIVVSANVRIHPDYLWDAVEPKIRAAMLERFSFEQRQLGQDVVLSEMVQTIQSVEGVVFVDVDTFDNVQEDISTEELVRLSTKLELSPRIRAYLAQVDRTALDPAVRIRPAQLVLLSPVVKETLILKELKR